METQGGSNWAPPSKMHFRVSNTDSFLHIKGSIYEKLKSRRRSLQIHISGIYGYTENLRIGHKIVKIKNCTKENFDHLSFEGRQNLTEAARTL